MEPAPDNLKNAAIAQIVAGLINVFILSWVTWLGMGTLCGLLTFGIGWICGFGGCLLVPLGIAEIASGALVLSNPREYGTLCRTVGFLQMPALLVGGVPSTIVGVLVVSMTGSDEVRLYLEE